MARYIEPWKCDPQTGRWHRFVVEDGTCYVEYYTEDLAPVFDRVRETKRVKNDINLEFIGAIPFDTFASWYADGVPVFNAEVGAEEAGKKLFKAKEFEYLLGPAAKGM